MYSSLSSQVTADDADEEAVRRKQREREAKALYAKGNKLGRKTFLEDHEGHDDFEKAGVPHVYNNIW